MTKLVNEAEKRLRAWLTRRKPPAGERLPAERVLAEELAVGAYALNRAVARLIAAGLLEREGYKLLVNEGGRAASRPGCHLVIARRSEHLPGYRRIARALEIDLVVHPWDASEEVEAILRRLEVGGNEGVICDPPAVFGQLSWVAAAQSLARKGAPVVSIGWATDEISSVSAGLARGVELAIAHLEELGHEELGLVTAPAVGARGVEMLEMWRSRCARGPRPASAERIHFQTASLRTPEDAGALATLLAGPWRKVTGLVLRVTHDCAIQLLLAELARHGRRVPESLSLVALGNARTLHTATPRITAATIDMALWQEMAFDLVRREVRRRKQPGVTTPSIVQVMPLLTVRESTRALESGRKKTGAPVAEEGAVPARRSRLDPERDDDSLARALEKRYPLAAKAALAERPRFAPVDLSPYVNRPLKFRRGWLGDLPLRSLDVGTHGIHGVPFRILGGARRSDGGAIVFRSAVNTTGGTHKLPERLVVPIDERAEAIYVLHGCGYAKFMQPFARYRFQGDSGELGSVPVVSLGLPPQAESEAGSRSAETAGANIQDWWSDFPHRDFPGARMAPLLKDDEADHVRRHVFLYTLEWINPRPAELVRYLEISVDPNVATTLGVLAVTVLKPRKGGI